MQTSQGHRRRAGGFAHALSEIALTLGALLGLVVTVVTIGAARTGIQPLVVRSGSMEPTIPTGSMILTKKIDAAAIEVGDVVAVERPDHTRVTHRVVQLERRGDLVDLTLKGDANEDADPVPVTVRQARKLVAEVPMVGRAMGWLASAQGGFVLGCLSTAFVCRVLRQRSNERSARQAAPQPVPLPSHA